ncbi:hypothetical protein YH66_12240 [[Brevibacterium] flavum]|uniref:Uncharacterized protein n=1 Tax=[Brevibacterium] flavum TaxID=92706 RepID=A0A0F6Z6I4_9CORY|nr:MULTISPECIES: hypothetical protein [Corynebacterium]AKF28258.1 hypothetical protein YH66_12240 [[Brevibacterium] flavum]ALP50858.1 hypothetical protein AC079_11885 [Corynebacterium glutamicum]ANE09098.1 hypothetical protein A3654_12320 [Corynebacterium glutamicum]ANR63288.1 hypothetical protein C628_11860 [[Brevibacterium] flavum ZL-1]ANR66293.1 hypothetical protein C627_11750 [Corynebacterium glutamicum ZL-6]
MVETLTISSGARGLQALIARAVGLDELANARFRQLTPEIVDVFVTTPFGVTASRRVGGHAGRDGAAVGAKDLLAALSENRDEVGASRDASWPGSLPPATGFTLIDELPTHIVRTLADQGQALARQFSGPMGPPSSLMDQEVIAAEGNGKTASIPMRTVFTCTSLGLIPGFEAPNEVPRHLRVSVNGRWTRIDAPYGSVYHSSGLGLSVF